MDLLGKLEYQPLFRKWTRGPPCSEDRKRRQPTYRVVYDFAPFRCLSSLRKYHFWVSYVSKQLLIKLIIKVPVQKKKHTLDLAWEISFFSWFTSYLLAIELTVEFDDEELKLPCLACWLDCPSLSFRLCIFSSSDVQNWTCWKMKDDFIRWMTKAYSEKILESTQEIASEKIHISKRNFCLFFATTL